VADTCLPIGPALANISVRAEARRVACELHPVPIRNFSGRRGEAAIFPCGRGAFLACRHRHFRLACSGASGLGAAQVWCEMLAVLKEYVRRDFTEIRAILQGDSGLMEPIYHL